MTSLYALNYDCPIPWPAQPAYPAPSRASRNKGKQRQQEAQQDEEQILGKAEATNNVEEDQCNCQHTSTTLRTGYLHALYTCQRNNPTRYFLTTLNAKNVAWSRQTADATSVDQLRDLLLDLDELDTKWHTTYSDLLGTWEEATQSKKEDGKQPEEQDLVGEASSSILTEGVRTHDIALQNDSVDQMLQDQIAGTDPQDRLFRQAYDAWRVSLECTRNSTNGTSVHEHATGKKKKKDVPKTSREWLSTMEVAEIKLQIVLSLEILARLPTPSSRLGPNRPTSSSRNTWFTDLRNSQLSNNNEDVLPASRKRKKADSEHTRLERQDGHSNGDTQEDNAKTDKRALEKLYKKMAIKLDQLTDNLAIHQAVSGLGFSLDDLVMDSNINGNSGVSAGEDGGGGELDAIQDFWTGTVEPEYSTRLPSDITSGCHSKFFSTSTSHARPANDPQQEDSPYHHPTPNLKALAKSVAAAQAADLAKKVPASPTLAKLLKANDEKQQINRRRGNEEQEANWLMPPSATKAQSTYSVFSDKETQAEEGRRKLKRSQSLNVQEVNPILGGSRNIFKSREVSFGQKKAESKASTTRTLSTANGNPTTKLGGIRKTSAFMRTNSVPLLQASVNITTSSLPSSASSDAIAADKLKHKPEAPSKHIDSTQNHKRKPASPKRLSTSMQREKSRTLVLATPAKLHKHGKSRLSIQATDDDDEEEEEEEEEPRHVDNSETMESLAEEEEEESPDEMDIIAYKPSSSTLTRTLVNETPRTERILAAETPASREIWVGETPGR